MTEHSPAASKPTDQLSVFNASEGFGCSKLAERPNNLNTTLSSNSLESKPSKLPGRRKIKEPGKQPNALKPSVKRSSLKSLRVPSTPTTSAVSGSFSLPTGLDFMTKPSKPSTASDSRAQPGSTQQLKLPYTRNLPAQVTTSKSCAQTCTSSLQNKALRTKSTTKPSSLPRTPKSRAKTKTLKSSALINPPKNNTSKSKSNM